MARGPIAEQDLSRRRGRGQSQRESECEAQRLDIDVWDVEISGVTDLDITFFELGERCVLECEPHVAADDDRWANLIRRYVVQGAMERPVSDLSRCVGKDVGKTAKSIYVLTKLTAMMCTYYAQDCSVYE